MGDVGLFGAYLRQVLLAHLLEARAVLVGDGLELFLGLLLLLGCPPR